ncbi:TerD family protein [Candidatus Accumulibacter contiguus]|jgi:tellurium resistance protein TerD|uniref:General stress protein 16U n=2 Tax=Candidatus Accumulibacter TaxID=327159 RepID=A0A080M9R0_9PROT|nr:TerD family protein [Candidatus Accumulibacter contiguus]KFB73859.1 MAG: General stress protein 16U [Candidatus Accumulibacter phosphatis]MBL8407085.1 TerD family protein [Accumulibacter sp.]NMQ03763.1 TerD family protein [Candidatus Accumulibacter contiguus]HRF10582.1 TerD family protein [Candidatus Accumulibacter phosphatis]
MAISLQKGGNVNLSKEAPSLKRMIIGLGWNARATDGAAFDLDSSAFILKSDGKVRNDADFIFYNNLKSSCGSVVHNGDNLTGIGEGDDETLTIELGKVPAEVDKVTIAVTIHEAEARGQNFGMVSKAYIRCIDADTSKEIARYDLSEDSSIETAMVFGEIYRLGADWKFKAVGQGFKGGLAPLARSFGVST